MSADIAGRRTAGQRLLDGIERAGNRVPHPAVIFLALIGLVIVLSAVLAWVGVSVTYQVEAPEPVPAEETYPGGSHEPSYLVPPEANYTHEYQTVTETAQVESLLSADGIRFIFTSAVSNFNTFGVVAVILVVLRGQGICDGRGDGQAGSVLDPRPLPVRLISGKHHRPSRSTTKSAAEKRRSRAAIRWRTPSRTGAGTSTGR